MPPKTDDDDSGSDSSNLSRAGGAGRALACRGRQGRGPRNRSRALVTALVVLPTASSGSVTPRTSSGRSAIWAIPPALSVMGP